MPPELMKRTPRAPVAVASISPEFVTETVLAALLTVSETAGFTAGDALLDMLPELVTVSESDVLAFRLVVVVGVVAVETVVLAASAGTGAAKAATDTIKALELTLPHQRDMIPPTQTVLFY